jgi:uncharacterized protein (TIGR00730 family)
MPIKAIAVFCGSKTGANPIYLDHAKELGMIMAKHAINLIYGGGKAGLMGVVADSSLQHGGTVRGIIPKILVNKEHQHDGLSELLVVEDMHQRKRKLYELCDAAIILPGGFGTLDEMFEIITWNQLTIHDKKIFILNSGGFYNHLLDHLQTMKDDGFLYNNLDDCIIMINEPQDIIKHFDQRPML